MPIQATFSRRFVMKAARDEGLNANQARAILAELPEGWFRGLKNYLSDSTYVEGQGLREWRSAFPGIFSGPDDRDSFLIRLVLAEDGGFAI